MLIFGPEGPLSIDERDVIAVHRGGGDGRFTFATLILNNGSEVSGAVAVDALARIRLARAVSAK